ncbi:helix-turn-helix domain-containing protein [Desulfosarcina alkanivorans]|nr:helix-turn-helix domain-containing protein [Desulfosarcina alkanivorans]
MMIKKKVLNPDRIRRIHGGFSFVPHRFLSQGFLSSLQQKEILLYLLLVLASDRHGLSFYSYDTICSLLQMNLDQYINARNGLIDKDLIAFDGTVFQVLELPATPVLSPTTLQVDSKPTKQPVSIARLVDRSLKRMTP